MADNGIYTSGGAFSAAHLVLHLIEKYTDRDTAIWCAKYFQLDWSRQSQLPFAVFVGQKAHADEVVRAVQDYIEGRYTEKITVEELADRHAMGRRTLERRFRQATGNSIVEYVQRVRVEAAKKRLETSRKSVAEVMYEVGYNDTKAACRRWAIASATTSSSGFSAMRCDRVSRAATSAGSGALP
jgi:transcriptional regulator GlxA family with amidase domain